jgi:heavy metal sensor kinase
VNRWWRSHSVRVRLTLFYLMAMILVLGVYDGAVFVFISRGLSETLNTQLRQDFFWVVASIYQNNDSTFALDEPEPLVPDEGLPWVQVWNSDGTRVLFRNSEAQRRPVPQQPPITVEGTVSLPTDTVPLRVLTRRGDFLMRRGALKDARVIIQVARSEGPMRQQMSELLLIFIFGLPAAVAVAGLGGYTIAKGALAPVERMTERARMISAERLSERLPVHNPDDEMGRLAIVFNETLGRLEASFDQMRRFTADVSHELRTPLTSIRSVGEVGLRGHRDEQTYRSIIGSMLEEADRLASLVDRLLTLSRAETRQASLSVESIDLRELTEDVAAHLGVLAEERRQALTIDIKGAPHALADRLVVRQALINLVDNAIKFSGVGGSIRIEAAETGGHAVIDVTDSGPGITGEARERIFDRFYRATTSATGTGLGLSLARGAVEANGGRLTLESSDAAGSRFRITLPLARSGPPSLEHRRDRTAA